jgi:hypothetical protein
MMKNGQELRGIRFVQIYPLQSSEKTSHLQIRIELLLRILIKERDEMKKFSRFIQRVLVIILSCALIGFMPPSISAAPKRVMLATTAYPPYYGELLPNQGVITEIIQEEFKHAEYEVIVKFLLPWKRAV